MNTRQRKKLCKKLSDLLPGVYEFDKEEGRHGIDYECGSYFEREWDWRDAYEDVRLWFIDACTEYTDDGMYYKGPERIYARRLLTFAAAQRNTAKATK